MGLPLVELGESGQNKDISHEGTVVLCGCGSRIPALALGEKFPECDPEVCAQGAQGSLQSLHFNVGFSH